MNSTDKVRVGVIGVGGFGICHVQVYSELPEVSLMAVADIDEKRAENVAAQYGVKHYYSDYRRLLDHKDIDIVSICTPEPDHREPTVHAAQAGKHILLEKPIATTLENAHAIVEAVNNAGVKLMIGFLFRFVTNRMRLKQYVESGLLGELVSASAIRHTKLSTARPVAARVGPGANIMEEGIHEIDLLRWWVNSDVETVYAKGVEKSLAEEFPGVCDVWSLTLSFRNGAIGHLESSWVLPVATWTRPKDWKKSWVACNLKFNIIGTKGTVFCDGFPTSIYAWDEEGWKFPDEGTLDFGYGKINGALKRELSHFVECIAKGIEMKGATVEDGQKALEIVFAAMKSSKENRPISLPL